MSTSSMSTNVWACPPMLLLPCFSSNKTRSLTTSFLLLQQWPLNLRCLSLIEVKILGKPARSTSFYPPSPLPTPPRHPRTSENLLVGARSSWPQSVILRPRFTRKANRSSCVGPSKPSTSLFFSFSFMRSFFRTASTSSAAPHRMSRGCTAIWWM